MVFSMAIIPVTTSSYFYDGHPAIVFIFRGLYKTQCRVYRTFKPWFCLISIGSWDKKPCHKIFDHVIKVVWLSYKYCEVILICSVFTKIFVFYAMLMIVSLPLLNFLMQFLFCLKCFFLSLNVQEILCIKSRLFIRTVVTIKAKKWVHSKLCLSKNIFWIQHLIKSKECFIKKKK